MWEVCGVEVSGQGEAREQSFHSAGLGERITQDGGADLLHQHAHFCHALCAGVSPDLSSWCNDSQPPQNYISFQSESAKRMESTSGIPGEDLIQGTSYNFVGRDAGASQLGAVTKGKYI